MKGANLSPQDHFVQIRELQTDGQLQDILRKNDFGSRIRHAAVIGSMPDIRTDEKDDKDEGAPGFRIKSEDGDVLMDINDDSSADTTLGSAALPPQMLVLVLDCGDTVFLYIRSRPDGTVEFEHSRFVSPTAQLVRPGFHLAVDPSSRYMALGCAERSFVVYELDSLKSLEEQSRRGETLTPVVSYHLRSVQGVIHQVQFLYPRPGDDHHVILLLIIVRNGKSRMATYEWELGDNLKDVFAEEKRGHRMPTENQMPLLLIPLKVRSAFIAISEEQIAVCTETLHGPPNFETFTIEEGRPPTDNFHGRNKPLWTAWARPFRLSEYFRTNDCIYLAREDGVVYFIEADSESTLTGSLYMDKFDCSISTAFSCLYDQYSDVLVMGGDSGPGAIWKVSFNPRMCQCRKLLLIYRSPRYRPDSLLCSSAHSRTGLLSSTSQRPTSSRRGTRRLVLRGLKWCLGRTRRPRSLIAYFQRLGGERKAQLPNTVTDSRLKSGWSTSVG